jgi:hypothetical protein
MNCQEALEAILEADPGVLEAPGATPLGLHLQECPRCRAKARAILQGEAHLAMGLARNLRAPDLDEILQQAAERGPAGVGSGRKALWSVSTGRVIRTLIPLAAAATLVLLLGRSPSLPGPTYLPRQGHPGLNVEVPQDQRVAVMETGNPDIAVVWIF